MLVYLGEIGWRGRQQNLEHFRILEAWLIDLWHSKLQTRGLNRWWANKNYWGEITLFKVCPWLLNMSHNTSFLFLFSQMPSIYKEERYCLLLFLPMSRASKSKCEMYSRKQLWQRGGRTFAEFSILPPDGATLKKLKPISSHAQKPKRQLSQPETRVSFLSLSNMSIRCYKPVKTRGTLV